MRLDWVVSSQEKSFGNRNVSKNVLKRQFQRRFPVSRLHYEPAEKKRQSCGWSGSPNSRSPGGRSTNRRSNSSTEPAKAGERDESFFEVSAPQQEKSLDDFLTVVPVLQLKFFQALAARTQKFLTTPSDFKAASSKCNKQNLYRSTCVFI